MLLVYRSMTGNVKRFVQSVIANDDRMKASPISSELIVNEPFILVTSTTGFGKPPSEVLSFLVKNAFFLKGVAASGNRNWGDHFAKSADEIARRYSVPVLLKFELAGQKADVESFLQKARELLLESEEEGIRQSS